MRLLERFLERHRARLQSRLELRLDIYLVAQPVTPTHPQARFSGCGLDCQPSAIHESMMLTKSNLFVPGAAFVLTAVSLITTAAILCPRASFAQTSSGRTQSIKAGSEAERKANLPKPPSFMTREERLRAKPLDPKATSGTPKPRKLTEAELKELQDAKPGRSAGGAPNPNAEAEARRQHPNDWK